MNVKVRMTIQRTGTSSVDGIGKIRTLELPPANLTAMVMAGIKNYLNLLSGGWIPFEETIALLERLGKNQQFCESVFRKPRVEYFLAELNIGDVYYVIPYETDRVSGVTHPTFFNLMHCYKAMSESCNSSNLPPQIKTLLLTIKSAPRSPVDIELHLQLIPDEYIEHLQRKVDCFYFSHPPLMVRGVDQNGGYWGEHFKDPQVRNYYSQRFMGAWFNLVRGDRQLIDNTGPIVQHACSNKTELHTYALYDFKGTTGALIFEVMGNHAHVALFDAVYENRTGAALELNELSRFCFSWLVLHLRKMGVKHVSTLKAFPRERNFILDLIETTGVTHD